MRVLKEGTKTLDDREQRIVERARVLTDHVAHKLSNLVVGLGAATHALRDLEAAATAALSDELATLGELASSYVSVLRETEHRLYAFHLDEALERWVQEAAPKHRPLEIDWDWTGVFGGTEWSEGDAQAMCAWLDSLASWLVQMPSARLALSTHDTALHQPSRVVVAASTSTHAQSALDALIARSIEVAGSKLRATSTSSCTLGSAYSVRLSVEPA